MGYFESRKIKVRTVIAIMFILIGILHFTHTKKFAQIIPPFIPTPITMVYISGFFEIIGGLGLFIPKVQRLAGCCLAILLVAVFPANVYIAVNNIQLGGILNNSILQWARLPLQAVFIWGVLWCTKK